MTRLHLPSTAAPISIEALASLAPAGALPLDAAARAGDPMGARIEARPAAAAP